MIGKKTLAVLVVLTSAAIFNVRTPRTVAQLRPISNERDLPRKLFRPSDMVHMAKDDADKIYDDSIRCTTRYLTLYNIAPEKRVDYIRMLDFECNSLSTQRTIVFVTPVDPDLTLVRLCIDDFGWSAQTWDDLGRTGSGPVVSVKKVDQPDPYFHEIVRDHTVPVFRHTKQVAKRGADGRVYYTTETVEEHGQSTHKVYLAHASWLVPAEIAGLAIDVQSDFPIYRADWFLANALITPAYYKFLGVKTLADFQNLVRFRQRDQDLSIKGVVSDSLEVALHQRAALFTPTSLGAYWETFDYFTSVNDDDLLDDLLLKRRDAGEIIATLPNGLQAYLLVNGKNELLDFADPNIAIDTHTPWKNKLVWSGISCITCHQFGMKDVADEVRVLSRPPFALLAKRRDDFKQVIDLFSTPIEEPIDTTKRLYIRSIGLCTGGSAPQDNAIFVQDAFVTYEQKDLDLFDAAMETGATIDEIKAILARTTGQDHTLTQLLAERPVRRDQWEAVGFGQLCTLTMPHR